MAVFALGAGRPGSDRTQKHMIEAALGTTDNYGNPFVIIKLRSTGVLASNTTTHGYEDTVVSLNTRTGELQVKHRSPGRLRWIRQSWGGKAIALIGRTPKNLEILARSFYDGDFVIEDSHHREEVKAIADKLIASLTPDEKAAMDERIRKSKIGTYGQKIAKSSAGAQEELVREKQRELSLREENLKKREAAVKTKEDGVKEKHIKNVKRDGTAVMVNLEALDNMKIYELRQVVRALGEKINVKMTIPELKERIRLLSDKGEQNILPPSKQGKIGADDFGDGVDEPPEKVG